MNEMNREMRRMSEREERLAKKADRNIGKYQTGEKVSRFKRISKYLLLMNPINNQLISTISQEDLLSGVIKTTIQSIF